jgi:hypothetical protein
VRWSPIVELRQYTLLRGCRDALVDLFEAELVEPQERAGMRVIGTFRDLDEPTRFVWLRGFESMSDRARGLAAFYDGPVWRQHREAANATMVDSDNVLLLRPGRANSGFALDVERPPIGAVNGSDRGVVEATVLSLEGPADPGVIAHFEREVAPRVQAAGGTLLAWLVSEESQNSFPRLPVREGEHVLVCFAAFADRPAYYAAARARAGMLQAASASPRLTAEPQVLALWPTRRSLVTGLTPGAVTQSQRAPADGIHQQATGGDQ